MTEGDDRIRRYYIFRAVTSFALWMPFWTLWAYENLESYLLLTVVDVGFWTTMIVLQIPAGLLGDRYGRRFVLFVGEILVSAGVLAFGLSTELWSLFVSNIVWATGICFVVSGDTPFVYDTLLELGRAREFISVMATGSAVMSVMNAVACVIGGMIVQWTEPHRLDLTLTISALIALVGSFTILTLKEPRVDRSHMRSYGTHLREGLKRVITSRAIIVLIMFQIVIEIAVYVMAVFRSVYMNETLELDYLQIGLFIAAFTLFGGFVATQAGRIEQRLGEKRSLLFLLLTIIISFTVVFLVASPIVILIQLPIYAVSYLQSPIIGGYINRRVDSAHRSTVVAIATLVFTALLAAVEIPSGWLANEFGAQATMLILAVAVAPIGLYLLMIWNREVDSATSASDIGARDRLNPGA